VRPIHIPLEPTEQSPPRSRVPLGSAGQSPSRSRVAKLPPSRKPISASLEGSGYTLKRVTHSPPRSRVADLPSSGVSSLASLEAVLRHKGQTAPPPNRSPYEGIQSQPLHHGSKDGRRQAATPTVDMTGVPSIDSGHHTTIPDAVVAPWDLRRGTRRARYCSRRHPGPPPSSRRPGDVTRPPDLLVCTPALRPGSPGPSRAITTTGTLQGVRRNPHRTKDDIQDDSDARRLPTVYVLQYPTTVTPRFKGKRRPQCPHSCTPPLLMPIKRGGGFPLAGGGLISLVWTLCLVSLASLLKRTRKVYRALISTDSTLSRDLGASLPLSPRLYPLLQALRVQDNTVPSHTHFAGRTASRPEPG